MLIFNTFQYSAKQLYITGNRWNKVEFVKNSLKLQASIYSRAN